MHDTRNGQRGAALRDAITWSRAHNHGLLALYFEHVWHVYERWGYYSTSD